MPENKVQGRVEAAERAAQVKKLDAEIAALEGQIEKELKKV